MAADRRQVNVRLSPELHTALMAESAGPGATVTAIVENALRSHLGFATERHAADTDLRGAIGEHEGRLGDHERRIGFLENLAREAGAMA